MKPTFEVGDWVQALEEISEVLPSGDVMHHGLKGAVGHVLEAFDDGWVNVYFERTGTVSICHGDEVLRLGSADTGRIARDRDRESA